MSYDSARAALRAATPGTSVVLDADQLPATVARLGAVVQLHTIKTGFARDGLRDLVALACEHDDAIDLGLWMVGTVLHGDAQAEVRIANGDDSGEWTVRIVLTDDATTRSIARDGLVLNIPDGPRPFQPSIAGLDVYVDNAELQLNRWRDRDTLVVEGSAEAMVALGQNLIELGATADQEQRSYATVDDMVMPTPSSELRILVAARMGELVTRPASEERWEPPPLPEAVAVSASSVHDELGDLVDQWLALEDDETLDVPPDLQSRPLSIPLDLSFSATLARGGVVESVLIAGAPADVVALGMWLASARTARSWEPSLLLTSAGAAVGALAQHELTEILPNAVRVHRTPAQDYASDLNATRASERTLVAKRWARPEFRDAFLDPIEAAISPEGRADHVVFTGRQVDLVALGGYVMAVGASQHSGTYELPWVSGMDVSVFVARMPDDS